MFFMVAIHHMKTFRNGVYPPYAILNLVESHHMVNIHHYLLYDCSCNGLPASEGPDTRVYGSNSNLWKIWWMYTIFVVLSFSRFISSSYSFWWSFYVLQNNNHGVGVTTLFGKCGLLDPHHDHHRRHHQASSTNEDSPNLRHMQQLLLF